jgi:hypothetical protein
MDIIVCKFPGGSRKTYDYLGNGEPVKAGDVCEVQTRRGGVTFVEVVAVNPRRRNFATKAIRRVLTHLEAAQHRGG